jgi:hypothetical protein
MGTLGLKLLLRKTSQSSIQQHNGTTGIYSIWRRVLNELEHADVTFYPTASWRYLQDMVNSVPELSIQQLVDSSTRRTSLGNCKMLM